MTAGGCPSCCGSWAGAPWSQCQEERKAEKEKKQVVMVVVVGAVEGRCWNWRHHFWGCSCGPLKEMGESR